MRGTVCCIQLNNLALDTCCGYIVYTLKALEANVILLAQRLAVYPSPFQPLACTCSYMLNLVSLVAHACVRDSLCELS